MFQQTYVQIAKKNLCRKLNKALYNWGKALHPHYDVFQPIVEMGLLIVEQNAHEKYELPCVGDYQRSVYQVFEEAVKAAAAPQVGDISALANVGTKVIPCTWYPYYIIVSTVYSEDFGQAVGSSLTSRYQNRGPHPRNRHRGDHGEDLSLGNGRQNQRLPCQGYSTIGRGAEAGSLHSEPAI